MNTSERMGISLIMGLINNILIQGGLISIIIGSLTFYTFISLPLLLKKIKGGA